MARMLFQGQREEIARTRVIIEFIGVSGSGKSSLARSVVRSLSGSHDAVLASDLVLRRLRLAELAAPTARNVAADLTAIVEMLHLSGEQRAFLTYALRRLRQHRPKNLQTLNYVRSVVRRLGVDGMARRRGRHMTVIADEGIVLVAYLLFVYGNTSFDEDDLAEFAETAPLPDRVVHVRAPLETLMRRTFSRPDPPRELRGRDAETVRRGLARAAEMFAGLVRTAPLRDRVLEVKNPGGAISEQALAAKIADSIRTLHNPSAAARSVASVEHVSKES